MKKKKQEDKLFLDIINFDWVVENLEKSLLDRRNKKNRFTSKMKLVPREKYGILKTPKGNFFIDSHGFGSVIPLQDETDVYFECKAILREGFSVSDAIRVPKISYDIRTKAKYLYKNYRVEEVIEIDDFLDSEHALRWKEVINSL